MANSTKRFISYIQFDADEPIPIATGYTRETCQATSIRRVLASGCVTGQIYIQERTDDVSQQTFVDLTEFLNMHFYEIDKAFREPRA